MIGVISLMIIAMWVLFIFAVNVEDDYLVFIASCGLILVSVYLMVNGLEGVDNWVTKSFAVIQIGVGFMGLLSPLMGIIDENGSRNEDD